ncbi:MAG: hypothetical protein A2X58_10970 [Nitrospirae bacterium GWC2_56_14]|nr:MAG: hypothetical protein A2X58_10970 [Nitrospirae bacterium GWC2_56_14]
MNTNKIYRVLALLLVAAVAIVAPLSAEAAGTASGISITNSATVNYEVSGVPQTAILTGPTATFVVDNKVNLTVTTTNGSYVSTAPSATSQVLTFRVTNNGNTTQDYSLASSATVTDPFGGADNFNATLVGVFVESGATAGYQTAEDTATFIDELVSDATATVYIVADIPAGRATNDIAAYALIATTHDGGSGGIGAATTDDSGAGNSLLGVDVVFADAANGTVPGDTQYDGEGSDRSAYRVTAAALTIAKTAVVYSDPFSTVNPKMIPGAVITYTITVTNGATGSQADNVSITDSLAAEIAAGRLAFNTQFNDGVDGCGAGSGIVVVGGLPTPCKTNTNDGDGADFGLSAADTVTVSGLTIPLSSSAVIKFQVVVQ